MRRGEIVIVAAQGDFGKPSPAVIVQADFFLAIHGTVLVCLLTSDLQDAPLFRIDVGPENGTGLVRPSQIMVDKIVPVSRLKIGQAIGRLDGAILQQLNRSLMVFLGLAS